jgi:hypothetical protein
VAGTKNSKEKKLNDLEMLDCLIENTYKELEQSIKENAKLGDFLKMIEMRHKLAPQKSAQNEFWKMLDRIREENLAKDNVNAEATAQPAAPEASSTKSKDRKPRASARETK